MKKSIGKQFKEGIVTKNPVFVQLLGLCPVLAVTTSVINALAMGATVVAVMTASNLLISLVRKLIPRRIRVASYAVIVSVFVTVAELAMKAFFPDISASLGLFVPLIAVNSLILLRAETFAAENGPVPSVADGIAYGVGFTAALLCVAAIRELLGTGKLFAAADGAGGITVLGEWYPAATVFLLPAGVLLTLGLVIAVFQKISDVSAEKRPNTEDAVTEGETEGETADE